MTPEEIEVFALEAAPRQILIAELVRATAERDGLRQVLKAAILSPDRVDGHWVEDAKGNSDYELFWTPEARAWAGLCGLDLDQYDVRDYPYRG